MAEWSKALVLKTNIFYKKYRGFESHFTRLAKINYICNNMKISIKYHIDFFKFKSFFLVFSFILTFIVCFFFRLELFFFLGKVLIPLKKRLIFTGLSSAFWSYIKLSLYTSLIFVSPLTVYLILLYSLKGIYKYKGILLGIFFFLLWLLSFLIGLNAFYLLYPFLFSFFVSFETPLSILPVTLEAGLDLYLKFFFNYMSSIGIIIGMPLILLSIKFLNTQITIFTRQLGYPLLLLVFLSIAPPEPLLQIILFLYLLVSVEIFLLGFFIFESFQKNFAGESRIRTCDEY